MATARFLMEFEVDGTVGGGRTVRLTRSGKAPWVLPLPAPLDQGEVTPALVDYVTTEYLLALPKESIRLGWETIYALVRLALLEADTEPPQAGHLPPYSGFDNPATTRPRPADKQQDNP